MRLPVVAQLLGDYYYIDSSSNSLLWCIGIVANKVVKDDKFMSKMGNTLSSTIPSKLKEAIGLTAEVKVMFVWKAMLVMEVRIIAADAVRVIERFKSSPYSESLQRIINLFEEGILSASLNHELALMIGDKLQERLGPVIQEKMGERGLHVEVVCRSDEDEAEFLLTFLKETAAAQK